MDCIKTFYYSDINSVTENFDKIFQTYLQDGVLCIKDSFFSEKDQKSITEALAKKIGLNYISQHDYEDHHRSIERVGLKSKDEVFINWHLEHVYSNNPQMMASWNMVHFTCEKGSGNTGFIKVDDLYSTIPTEYLEFLNNCNIEQNQKTRTAVAYYDLLKKNILRVDVNKGSDTLVEYQKMIPTKDQIDYFALIQNHIHEVVYSTPSIQKWWEWQTGDMIIIDLHRMIHCVKGGFDSSQRKFRRFWAYKNNPSEYEYNFFGNREQK